MYIVFYNFDPSGLRLRGASGSSEKASFPRQDG